QSAAKQCGIGERTLRRWLAEDADFRVEYDAARIAAFQAGMARIHALTGRAVDTLTDLLEAEKYPAVRLGAARAVFDLGLHERDAVAIIARLDDIERAQRRSEK